MTTRLPRQTVSFDDPKVNELARDTIAALKSLPDVVYVTWSGLWSIPITITPAFPDGSKRTSEPTEVRCHRAAQLNDSTAVVKPGGISWNWVGNAVQVNDVDGLVLGESYALGFAVIG